MGGESIRQQRPIPSRALLALAIGAVAAASGCAKPCDGYFSCTDYGPALFAE